jgi:hypothetical protein
MTGLFWICEVAFMLHCTKQMGPTGLPTRGELSECFGNRNFSR